MKTNLTPEEIVDSYLPNYKERFEVFWADECKKYSTEFRSSELFYEIHFPEALTAYSEALCKEQREINRKDAIDSFNMFLGKTNMYRTEQMIALNDFCRNYDRSANIAPSPVEG